VVDFVIEIQYILKKDQFKTLLLLFSNIQSLFPQLFVGGLMSYLGCSVHLFHQLFVGGLKRLTEHPK
jgi:hypothetical protein